MRLIKRGRLISELIDWQLTEAPEEGVNYQDGRMVTDHERQYEAYLLLEEVIKTVAEQETVEAIPIEWIKRWAMKSENTYNREQIVEMLNDWEAENG